MRARRAPGVAGRLGGLVAAPLARVVDLEVASRPEAQVRLAHHDGEEAVRDLVIQQSLPAAREDAVVERLSVEVEVEEP